MNLGWNFLGILCEFFWSSLRIFREFYGNTLGIYGWGFWFGNFLWILCEFLGNSLLIHLKSLGIHWEFYWNSIGILLGCMFLGFWMCGCWFWVISVNDWMTNKKQKRIPRSASWRLLALKNNRSIIKRTNFSKINSKRDCLVLMNLMADM